MNSSKKCSCPWSRGRDDSPRQAEENFQKSTSSLITHYYRFGKPDCRFSSYLFSSRKGQIYPHFRFSYLFFRPKCRSRFYALKNIYLVALLGIWQLYLKMKQLFYFKSCLTRRYFDPTSKKARRNRRGYKIFGRFDVSRSPDKCSCIMRTLLPTEGVIHSDAPALVALARFLIYLISLVSG